MLLFVGLSAATWSFFHSFFITHFWQKLQHRKWPSLGPYSRLIYVIFSSVSLLGVFGWWRTLPQALLWNWPGPWQYLRLAGILSAMVFFVLGAAAYDNRAFLGLRQLANHLRGIDGGQPEFSRKGVLARVRHPWYTGTILFFVFAMPVTDVNLVWRLVFIAYTLIGTEIEEKKLSVEWGDQYVQYKKEVGRFLPW
ncbi:MAG: hypothetical protein GY780_06585 [bacterium]|nr:hypothetical protein [bacterium]